MAKRTTSGESTSLVPAAVVRRVVKQEPVAFLGDSLIAAQTEDGIVHIGISGMCAALGLDNSSQLKRIKRSTVLAEGMETLILETPGGLQATNCLRVDLLALWLAGAETSRMPADVKTKIEAYQRELAPIAMQLFIRHLMTDPAAPPDSLVVELRTQIAELQGIIRLLQEHMALYMRQQAALPHQLDRIFGLLESALQGQQQLQQHQLQTEAHLEQLDQEQPLTAKHKYTLQRKIDEIVRQTRHSANPVKHWQLYGKLKTRFSVNSYAEIPEGMFEAALAQLVDIQTKLTGEASLDQLSFLP